MKYISMDIGENELLGTEDQMAIELNQFRKLQRKLNGESWNEFYENYLCALGEKASGNRALHLYESQDWKKVGNTGSILIIVGTTICGMFTFTSYASVIVIGSLNFMSTLVATLLKFYQPELKAQAHLQASQRYGRLHRKIALELNLNRTDRDKSDGLCNYSKQEYDRIIEEAPVLTKKTLRWFRNEIGDLEEPCALPDILNTIQPIHVNRNT
mgnify:CR=1 FL=1